MTLKACCYDGRTAPIVVGKCYNLSGIEDDGVTVELIKNYKNFAPSLMSVFHNQPCTKSQPWHQHFEITAIFLDQKLQLDSV